MIKLFLLLNSAVCLMANEIQSEFYKSLKNMDYNENTLILNIFAVVFLVTSLIFVFKILLNKPMQTSTNIKEIKHEKYIAKLNFHYSIQKSKKQNIIQTLESYFDILHIKAAKGSNRVIFHFNQNQGRYFLMNSQEINLTLFSLLEFLLENTTNAVITINIKPNSQGKLIKNGTKIQNYHFFVRVNKNLKDLEFRINSVLTNNAKDLKLKYLTQAKNFAGEFGYEITCELHEKFSTFGFYKDLYELGLKTPKQNQALTNKNCVILDDDISAFGNFALLLRSFGANTQPFLSTNTSKNHIFNAIFKPDFVIINTKFFHTNSKNSKAFSKDEIEALMRAKRNKNFVLILVSNSANYDEIDNKLSDYYLLKEPFCADVFLEILQDKNNKKQSWL